MSGVNRFVRCQWTAVARRAVSTTNAHTGLYALDTFDVANAFSASAGGRLNVANIQLQDQLGSSLNETICSCSSIR